MKSTVALVTGGSRGLGKSAALHLASAGVGVVVTYQTNQAEADGVVATITADGGRAAALKLDLADSAGFSSFRDRMTSVLRESFGQDRIDFLVNNAGYGLFKPFAETTSDELDAQYAVHIKGPFLLTQSLADLIADGGRILNVSSGLTRMTFAGYDAYSIMKGGVEVMTRYQAAAFAGRGIAVNTLAPGAIETDFGGGAVRDDAALNKQIADMTAMGRVGLPEDIGSAVAGLLTGGSTWMTGQRIEVSGGQGL